MLYEEYREPQVGNRIKPLVPTNVYGKATLDGYCAFDKYRNAFQYNISTEDIYEVVEVLQAKTYKKIWVCRSLSTDKVSLFNLSEERATFFELIIPKTPEELYQCFVEGVK